MTLIYQKDISWRALDGLMIERCFFIFRSGQTPSNTSQWKERDAHCLSAGLTVTLGPQVVPDGSKVNWFGEGCLRGSDWEADGPVSVLCKVQSCVTYWHTLVCLEYHWVLGCEKNKPDCLKKLSPCLVLCSPPELDKHKRNAASTEVSCFLYLLIICDCSLFFYLATESHRNLDDSLHLDSGFTRPCFVPCPYTVMWQMHMVRMAFALHHCVCVCHVFVVVEGYGGLRWAFSPPAETCQSPRGAGPRFTGQLRQPWQPGSSRLEQGMPLCRLLPGQDLFPSCHFTSTSSTFN